MSWLQSQLLVIAERPWRWTVEPTYGAAGEELTPGVKSAPLDGVFILLSDALIDELKARLTAAEKAELAGYVNRYSEAQCAMWHVPVWAGQSSAVFVRVPASVWGDPTGEPPAKVKRFFARVWREAGA